MTKSVGYTETAPACSRGGGGALEADVDGARRPWSKMKGIKRNPGRDLGFAGTFEVGVATRVPQGGDLWSHLDPPS